MIDLHSHILPGIDDGARDISDSIALAKQSVDAGVTSMVCTPHIHLGTFNNNLETIQQAYDEFKNACVQAAIPLKVSFAAEVRLCPEIVQLIQSDRLPFIGHYRNKPALLLELPHSHIPAGTDMLVKWLLNHGVQPVIPHPERNREIMANYEKLHWLKNIGCIFQITAGSLTGAFKPECEELAWFMVEQKLAAYVASDLHNLHRRPNEMGAAYALVHERYGQSLAEGLFIKIPQIITQHTHWDN